MLKIKKNQSLIYSHFSKFSSLFWQERSSLFLVLAGDTSVDRNSVVISNFLNETLGGQFLDGTTSQRGVNTKTVRDDGGSNHLRLGDFLLQLSPCFLVKDNLVGLLVLDLTLGPLKRKITCQIVLFEVKIIAPNKNRFRKLNWIIKWINYLDSFLLE